MESLGYSEHFLALDTTRALLVWDAGARAGEPARSQFPEELLRRKSGLGGEQAASNHLLMYTCACASPQ